MPWRYAVLRNARVLARCLPSGELVVEGGRVEIRYKPQDGRAYHANVRNLTALPDEPVLPDETCIAAQGDAAGDLKKSKGIARGDSRARVAPGDQALPGDSSNLPGTIIAYTDGACSGNPGPCGVGVVLMDGDGRREYSGYLGHGTNNVAELKAIQIAADALSGVQRPVRIHTDSSYSIGVLTKGWKAKANVELIAETKRSLSRLSDVGLIHVRGHAGIPENERADQLAVAAVSARKSAGWT